MATTTPERDGDGETVAYIVSGLPQQIQNLLTADRVNTISDGDSRYYFIRNFGAPTKHLVIRTRENVEDFTGGAITVKTTDDGTVDEATIPITNEGIIDIENVAHTRSTSSTSTSTPGAPDTGAPDTSTPSATPGAPDTGAPRTSTTTGAPPDPATTTTSDPTQAFDVEEIAKSVTVIETKDLGDTLDVLYEQHNIPNPFKGKRYGWVRAVPVDYQDLTPKPADDLEDKVDKTIIRKVAEKLFADDDGTLPEKVETLVAKIEEVIDSKEGFGKTVKQLLGITKIQNYMKQIREERAKRGKTYTDKEWNKESMKLLTSLSKAVESVGRVIAVQRAKVKGDIPDFGLISSEGIVLSRKISIPSARKTVDSVKIKKPRKDNIVFQDTVQETKGETLASVYELVPDPRIASLAYIKEGGRFEMYLKIAKSGVNKWLRVNPPDDEGDVGTGVYDKLWVDGIGQFIIQGVDLPNT